MQLQQKGHLEYTLLEEENIDQKSTLEYIGEISKEHFNLVRFLDMPFLIGEHFRLYQWGWPRLPSERTMKNYKDCYLYPKEWEIMSKLIIIGGCVKIPDGRVGRVREKIYNQYRVRVRRKTSVSHQFLLFDVHELKPVDCPKGWMSTEGYNRYLKTTLAKMKERESKS